MLQGKEGGVYPGGEGREGSSGLSCSSARPASQPRLQVPSRLLQGRTGLLQAGVDIAPRVAGHCAGG